MIGLLELALLACTLLALGVWVVVAAIAPRLGAGGFGQSGLAEWTARAWLYAPFWVSALIVGGALLPGILVALGAGGDHCLLHGQGGHHHHLCVLHPPHVSGRVLPWLIPLGVFGPALALLGFCALRARRQWRLASTLVSLGRPSDFGADVRLLDRDEPVALTVGWRRPTVLLSTGLLDRLPATSVEVVLAHERAHVARRDTWLGLFDRFAAALLPRRAAASLMGRIALARERACDAIAARSVPGGNLAVARALAQVTGLNIQAQDTGVAVGGGDVEARILSLTTPSAPAPRAWGLPIVAAGLFVLGVGPLHSALEHLVTALLH